MVYYSIIQYPLCFLGSVAYANFQAKVQGFRLPRFGWPRQKVLKCPVLDPFVYLGVQVAVPGLL